MGYKYNAPPEKEWLLNCINTIHPNALIFKKNDFLSRYNLLNEFDRLGLNRDRVQMYYQASDLHKYL